MDSSSTHREKECFLVLHLLTVNTSSNCRCFTGNYSIVIDGVIRYTGVAGTAGTPITVWTIGRLVAFDFVADLDYKFGMYTTLPVATSYVNAFKLQNMADCRIYTTKIKGFNIALTCLARGASNGGFTAIPFYRYYGFKRN